MPKTSNKESYGKGMGKQDIYKKLDSFKTDEGKAKYLSEILTKKGMLAPKTCKAVEEVKDEIYAKAAQTAAKNCKFNHSAEYIGKITDPKLKKELYKKAIQDTFKKSESDYGVSFYHPLIFAEKSGNKKLIQETYKKAAQAAAERGFFEEAVKLIEEIKDPKIKKELYAKAAQREIAKGTKSRPYEAGIYAEKSGNKKLADEIYAKAAQKSAEKWWFESAAYFAESITNPKLKKEAYEKIVQFAKKSGSSVYEGILSYGKIADILEREGNVMKAKSLRKKTERLGKK